MMQPMMIDPRDLDDSNRKYIVSIRQANNGYAVEVDIDQSYKEQLSPAEAQKRIAKFVKGMQSKIEGSGDALLDTILEKAQDEDEGDKVQLLGLHIFTTFTKLTEFLAFVYERNKDDKKPSKKK